MPYEKKEHSMLYNKLDDTIIIVGGNDKKCFIYDIKSEKFSELPETNDICLKPALLIKNNYLYVFDSFERKKKFFEKLNIEKNENFEKFTPKGYSLNNNKFFGICESNNVDNIVICGGERTGANTIIYEIKNNNLLKAKGKDINCKLDDKTFYKINQNYYINIPYSKDPGEKSIIAFDKRTNDTFKIMFDKEGKTTFKFDINEENDISIEPVFENKKLSESVSIINSKEVNDENNNFNKDNEKLISQSVITFNNNLNINNDEIRLKEKNLKRELPEINNNEENIDPNNINIHNKDKDKDNNNELKELEINFEQEAKEREEGKLLYKFKKSPRLYISTNSLNEKKE